MSKPSPKSAREWLLILTILLLAAALRWRQPGLVEFKYDEAHITGMALQIAAGDALPLLSGGTSLGLQRPALDAYLLALPLFVSGGRIETAVWFTGALGVIAAALVYALGRRIAGSRAGLMAALFMAANPWLVLYDRKLWAHIQVVFSATLLLLAWNVIVRRHKRATFWFPVVATLQLLTHTLALVQGLSWLGAIFVAPARWRTRRFAWGLVVGLILIAPYLWALSDWLGAALQPARPALPLATHLIRDEVSGGQSLQTNLGMAGQLFGGQGLALLAGNADPANPIWLLSRLAAILVSILIMIGLLRALRWLRQPQRKESARLLLAWGVGPTLVLLLAPLTVYPQYWTVLLPLPALFFGFGLDGLTRLPSTAAGRQAAATTMWIVAAGIAVLWVAAYGTLLGLVADGAGTAAFGVPLLRWQQTVTIAETHAKALGIDQIRVAVRGVDPGQDSDAAAVAALISSPPFARFVAPASPAALLLSEGRDSLYLWAQDAAESETKLAEMGELLWQGELAKGLPPIKLYHVPARAPQELAAQVLQPPAAFDLGVELVGFAAPASVAPGQPAEVTLIWRMTAPRADVRTRDFTAFNHILNAAGERVAQVDGMAMLSRDWWPGDILVQPYRLQLPPGNYIWRVGLYSRTDGGRAQRLDGGDVVDLPFTVPGG